MKATLLLWGKRYEAEGETIKDAISKIAVRNPKGKAILIVENGDKRKEKILPARHLHQLFNTHGIMREVALKNVSMLFDV